MFNFFKRSDKGASSPSMRPRSPSTRTSRARGLDSLEPLPLPEVQEGNLDSDWAMWEDSVLEQDSHPPSQYADTVPSHLDAVPDVALDTAADPFAQVSKKAP